MAGHSRALDWISGIRLTSVDCFLQPGHRFPWNFRQVSLSLAQAAGGILQPGQRARRTPHSVTGLQVLHVKV